MIYQTVALNYVRIVNPDLYGHASQWEKPPPHWSAGTLRADETRAGNWTVVKDGKLTIPLEEWFDFLERRTAKIRG